jgi:hypothetical protein
MSLALKSGIPRLPRTNIENLLSPVTGVNNIATVMNPDKSGLAGGDIGT